MAKILLVEDDNNLREIYEARFKAEGYDIVSAHDGEEALVVAKSEKPDLVISDVMMPKISGFEMLDILRNTDSLKNVKVIMLTALGQSDDQQRADKLGADRYLVKSQVTLEDIVNVANELMNPGTQADVTMPSTPSAVPTTSAALTPQAAPAPSTMPLADPSASPASSVSPMAAPSPLPAPTTEPSNPPTSPIVTALNATDPDGPAVQNSLASEPNDSVPTPVSTPPVNDTAAAPATEPLSTETAQEPSASPVNNPADLKLAEPAKQEEKNVSSQIDSIMNNSNSNGAANVSLPQPSGELSSMSNPLQDKPAEYSPNPVGKKVIEPLSGEEKKPDIKELLDKEAAMEMATSSLTDQPSGEPAPAVNSEPKDQAPTSQAPTESNPNTFDPSNIAL